MVFRLVRNQSTSTSTRN